MNNTALAPTPSPIALPAGGGERIWIVGDTMEIKATAAETGGALTVLEVKTDPGSGPPPHTHAHEDEGFYVLEGTFEIQLGEQVIECEPGAFAFAPKGTVHRFRCVGQETGRILVFFTPAGIEGFFREAGTPAVGDGPAPPLDAAEIARTGIAGDRYGLQVVDWTK